MPRDLDLLATGKGGLEFPRLASIQSSPFAGPDLSDFRMPLGNRDAPAWLAAYEPRRNSGRPSAGSAFRVGGRYCLVSRDPDSDRCLKGHSLEEWISDSS